MAQVEIRGVARRFGRVAALRSIDLDVGDGELCVIVGPSGCGKSTLLRAIAGLEPVDEGTIRIGGEDVTTAPPRARDVAFVFQSYALYPHLTVRGNLEFPLRVRGVDASERENRVREAAELLAIEALLDRKPRELSGGQRQRVAIGRAVVRRPKVFLFDEPLSNLDAQLRSRMRVELIELHRRLRATIVYVTHDQTEAMTLGEKVVVMEAGVVRQVGSAREVYDRPANLFVARFMGNPPMNVFAGEIVEGRRSFRAPGFEMPAPEALSPGKVALGVRPADLEPSADGALPMRVRVVEDTGADRHAFGEVGGVETIVRLPTELSPTEELRLTVRDDAAHWFDGEGFRLSPTGGRDRAKRE